MPRPNAGPAINQGLGLGVDGRTGTFPEVFSKGFYCFYAPLQWMARDREGSAWQRIMESEKILSTLATGPPRTGRAAQVSERTIAALPEGDSTVAIDWTGDRIATGHRDGYIRIRTPDETIRVIDAHLGPVRALAFTPDGRLLSGGFDARLCTWEPESGECLAILKHHKRSIECIALIPDATRFATASGDRFVRLWDTLPSWQRTKRAQHLAAVETRMAARVQSDVERLGAVAAFQAVNNDLDLSPDERQAARNIILRDH